MKIIEEELKESNISSKEIDNLLEYKTKKIYLTKFIKSLRL